MSRSRKPLVRTPLRPRSVRQARKDRAYEPTRRLVLIEEAYCRVLMVDSGLAQAGSLCAFVSEDVHHIVSRARGGTNERSNLAAVCHEHHMWLHQTVEGQRWGAKHGLLLHAWEVR